VKAAPSKASEGIAKAKAAVEPVVAPVVAVISPPQYATLVQRFLANLLDLLVGGGIVVTGAIGGWALSAVAAPVAILWGVIAGVGVVIYYPLASSLNNGATLGKKAVGIRVAYEDGLTAPGFAHFLGRMFVVQFVNGATGGLDQIAGMFDDKRRTLHDRAMGTVVIKA
jgi:uncharacterized RDD family membrane protein YckC